MLIVLAGIFSIAVVFSRESSDMFRLPKTLVLQAEAILLVGVTLAARIFGAYWPRLEWSEPGVFVPLAAFATFALLTLTSTRMDLSRSALGPAAATLVVFLATVWMARLRRGSVMVIVPLVAAAANALLVIAEESRLWMPFGVRAGDHHLQCTALVGNPNEVGSYLAIAALAALAMWTGPSLRILSGTAFVVLIAGLIASRTLTAMAAFAAGAVVMFALSSWKQALRVGAYVIVVAVLLVAFAAPFRARARQLIKLARSGEYNALVTERGTPFVAASMMFADHPFLGAGTGTFAWHYYDYKLRAEQRYPALRTAYNRGMNYGEVHNDHLQVLAEGGVLGYAAFLAAIACLGAISLRAPSRELVRSLALPLAVCWFVLSLAQFPLETTVVRSLLVHFAALCVAWRTA